MQQTLESILQAVHTEAREHMPQPTVAYDSLEGVVMYGPQSTINTVFNTVLERLGARDVEGLAELEEADGTEDVSVDFTLQGHRVYLTTCFESA